jgi:hypothetical protein
MIMGSTSQKGLWFAAAPRGGRAGPCLVLPEKPSAHRPGQGHTHLRLAFMTMKDSLAATTADGRKLIVDERVEIVGAFGQQDSTMMS